MFGLVVWVFVAIVCLAVIPMFFSSVSYDITGGFGGPSNSESQKAANILNAGFPNSNNDSGDTVLVVLQGAQVYSDAVKNAVLGLNYTIATDNGVANFSGESSVYTVEYNLLASSVPSLVPQVASLESEVASANAELHSLEQNLSSLSTGLFQLEAGINQTAQLVYGVPAAFVQAWEGVVSQGVSDPYVANVEANATVFNITDSFGGSAESIGYYSAFFPVWNSTFRSLPSSTSVLEREVLAINQSVATFLGSGLVDSQTAQMVATVESGLNVTDWNQSDAVGNLTVSAMASNVPAELTTTLGVTPTGLVDQLYGFGSSPSDATLANYTISLSESSFAGMLNSSSGFSASQFLYAAYNLGLSPSFSQVWNLASVFVADGTQTAFSGSPLFSVNSTSLADLLSILPENATAANVEDAVANVVSTQPFQDYPYVPASSVT